MIERETIDLKNAEDKNPEVPGAHGPTSEFRGAAGRSILALSARRVNRFVCISDRISNDRLLVYRQHAMFLGYPSANI